MKVIGIVAEYNPLHNGHVYQIEYAKNELQADAIVVVLAGDFLQRGLPAVMERTLRAKAAIAAGADVVFEMPTVVATSSANDYALGSIALLHHCGVVTDLLFGCENGTDDDFLRAAKAIEELEGTDAFSDAINEYKSKGCSFAEARAKAICKMKPDLSEAFLSSPNNTLGIEYVRALLHFKSDIKTNALPRVGAQHGSSKTLDQYASASLIRDMLSKGDDVATFVPEATKHLLYDVTVPLLYPDDFSLLMHQRLLEEDSFQRYLDCNKDISNKISNNRDAFVSYNSFAQLLKSKDLELSRIQRILTHILLRISDNHRNLLHRMDYETYLHLLAFSDQGKALLKEMKKTAHLPIFQSPKEAEQKLSQVQQKIFHVDLKAADTYRMVATNKYKQAFPTEYTRKFT